MIIMKGLPASGKSTKAKELLENGNTIRINKDLLRTMLHFDKFTGKNESHTQDCSRKIADWFLSQGVNVIIDDTNLNPNTVQGWKDLSKIHNATIEYQDFTDVPVDTCILRDMDREKKVGDDVITKMALRYLDYMKGEKVVICDIDGTIADCEHRRHYVEKTPKDWKGFFSEMDTDPLRKDIWEKVMRCSEENSAHIIFVSGRSEEYREITEDWFMNYKIYEYNCLIMREKHDSREDTVVKSEIYDKYLKNMNIVKVFDDRPSVIRMWREKGLDVEDVGNGVEF